MANSHHTLASGVRVIHIHPTAPAKPAEGAPCNGCGVCCLVAPCPLGMLLSARRQGACAALQWVGASHQYRCGAVSQPRQVLTQQLPRVLLGLIPPLAWMLARWSRRWIASGAGCDCDWQPGTRDRLTTQNGDNGVSTPSEP